MTDYKHLAARYLVLIEGGPPANYSAWSPDLPGCVATARTKEELDVSIREAIQLHLEGLAEDQLPIPEPSCRVEYVEVDA